MEENKRREEIIPNEEINKEEAVLEPTEEQETVEAYESISLASGDSDYEDVPKVEGDIEAHNFFAGNEHVSPVNGSLTYKKHLFTIKGIGGFDLPITISYNSENSHRSYYEGDYPYKIAQGWHFCFDGMCTFDNAYLSDWYSMFKFADGSSYLIDSSSDNEAGKEEDRYQKKDVEITSSSVRYLNGVTETFYGHGGINQMTDRFGNGYIFEYDSNARLTKIKTIGNTSDCVNFEWIEETNTTPKMLNVSYRSYTVTFILEQRQTDGLVDLVSSITDADEFTTSFEYETPNGSYTYKRWEGSTPNIFEMDYSISAYYHLINKVTYPTGGHRKYTYTTVPGEGAAAYTRYIVQKAELCEGSTVIDTVNYTYQNYNVGQSPMLITDFEGNNIGETDDNGNLIFNLKTSQTDNGKTVTHYAFTEKGIKLAEEVYIKGNTLPYSKTVYTIDSTNQLPTNIKTGLYNNGSWVTEEESFVYIPYYDLVTEKTDKAERTTYYTYDMPTDTDKNHYGLLLTEDYMGIVKIYALSTDSKKVLNVRTEYGNKTVVVIYTYDTNVPCNIIKEEVSVRPHGEMEYENISTVAYTYTSDNKFIEKKIVKNVKSQINPVSYGDRDDLVTEYAYDLQGRLSFEKQPNGNGESIIYDCSGKIRAKITEEGSTIENIYSTLPTEHCYYSISYYAGLDSGIEKKYCCDLLGRITEEINTIKVDNSENTYYTVNEYEYTGKNLTKVKSGFGSYTVYTYDAFDRVVSSKVYNSSNVLQYEKTVTYDDVNRTKLTRKGTAFEKVYFDVLGRKVKVEIGITNEFDTEVNHTTTFTYDNFDRVLTSSVADEYTTLTTTNVYSNDGNLLLVIDPMGNITEYTYNLWDKVATVKYPNNAVYTYTYDTIGRLIKETDPANNSSYNVYDSNSNIIEKYDKKGYIYSYTFDNMNRVINYAGDIDYTYIGTGALRTMTDETGTTTYNYDLNARLLSKVTPQGTVTYTYYDHGGLKSVKDPDGFETIYTYDDFGRMSTIVKKYDIYTDELMSYSYNNFGMVSQKVTPNSKTIYEYDDFNQVFTETFYIKETNASNYTQIKEIGYAYDGFGNIIGRFTVTDEVDKTEYYTYDNLFRLVDYSGEHNNSDYYPSWSESYEYDCMGNRVKLINSYSASMYNVVDYQIEYTYNNLNRLVTERKTQNGATVYNYTYNYDEDGNMTYDPRTNKEYSYDWRFNKISSITDSENNHWEYTYNGKGELVETNEIPASADTEENQKIFLWDERGFMLCENNGYIQTYSNIVGVDGIIARIYCPYNSVTYLVKNAHGDVIYTQDSNTITKYYDYDPFGNETNPDETDTNPFRYCGEYLDCYTNTYYLRNRVYSPAIGRFTTVDPARDGLNWYAYCSNNPVNFIDPHGLEYGKLREFVEDYRYLFDNVTIETAEGVDFAYITMDDYGRAFYFDGTVIERYFDAATGSLLSETKVKIADNIDGSLWLQREDFLEAMGMVEDGTAVVDTVEKFKVNNNVALLDFASTLFGNASNGGDMATVAKYFNVGAEAAKLLARAFAWIFTMEDLSGGKMMSVGEYKSEVIRVYSPNANKYHRVDTIYGIEDNTDYYKYVKKFKMRN